MKTIDEKMASEIKRVTEKRREERKMKEMLL